MNEEKENNRFWKYLFFGFAILLVSVVTANIELRNNDGWILISTPDNETWFINYNETKYNSSSGSFIYNNYFNQTLNTTSNISANSFCLEGNCKTSWYTAPPVKFVTLQAQATTDTNAPLAQRAFANTYFFVVTDLTEYTQYRFGVSRAATNGATNYEGLIKYRTGACNTITPGSWNNLGSNTIDLTAQNLAQATAYENMDAGALTTDVCIGLFTQGGDGVLDPQIRNIWVEFK